MKHLYFMRHGESESNALGICAGHTDVALTQEGRRQAIDAGKQLAGSGIAFDLIVSSPLQRALVTAQEIAAIIGFSQENIVVHPDAIERFRGDLEGRPSDDQNNMSEAVFASHGAESEEAMILRAERLIDFLSQRPEQSILVVSHNQFGRTFIAQCRGLLWNDVDKLPNAKPILVPLPQRS